MPNLTKLDWLRILARGALVCRTCKIEKALAAFPRSMRPPNLRRICRDCYYAQKKDWERRRQQHVREYHRKYRCQQYGITIADYDAMLELQQGKCPICYQALGPKGQTIDHDHKTGKVRGIVHSKCNLVIGNASEDISVLVGAIRYLVAHRGDTVQQQIELTPVIQSKGAEIGGEAWP